MTEQDWIDLGKRAVACKGWLWTPGARAMYAETCPMYCSDLPPYVAGGDAGIVLEVHGKSVRTTRDCTTRAVPDFSDPGTLGGLLALVREHLCDPGAYVECHSDSKVWQVWVATEVGHPVAMGVGAFSEAEALVIALEKAPAKESPDA